MKRGRHDECRACLFGLQPDCDSVIIFRGDTAKDYSLTSAEETYSADSAEFRKVMDILFRCTYHCSFRMLMRANNIEGNHAGFWLYAYLGHGDDRVDFSCGRTGEILIDGIAWRVGLTSGALKEKKKATSDEEKKNDEKWPRVFKISHVVAAVSAV